MLGQVGDIEVGKSCLWVENTYVFLTFSYWNSIRCLSEIQLQQKIIRLHHCPYLVQSFHLEFLLLYQTVQNSEVENWSNFVSLLDWKQHWQELVCYCCCFYYCSFREQMAFSIQKQSNLDNQPQACHCRAFGKLLTLGRKSSVGGVIDCCGRYCECSMFVRALVPVPLTLAIIGLANIGTKELVSMYLEVNWFPWGKNFGICFGVVMFTLNSLMEFVWEEITICCYIPL